LARGGKKAGTRYGGHGRKNFLKGDKAAGFQKKEETPLKRRGWFSRRGQRSIIRGERTDSFENEAPRHFVGEGPVIRGSKKGGNLKKVLQQEIPTRQKKGFTEKRRLCQVWISTPSL